jgi:hypothetical protein
MQNLRVNNFVNGANVLSANAKKNDMGKCTE